MLRDQRPIVAGYACGDHFLSVSPPSKLSTERLNDEVQARVYLARRIRADTELARQNPNQGIRLVPDIGTAAAVGLRWLLDHAGRGPQFRLCAEAGRGLSRCRA